jgi:hypothetical protein
MIPISSHSLRSPPFQSVSPPQNCQAWLDAMNAAEAGGCGAGGTQPKAKQAHGNKKRSRVDGSAVRKEAEDAIRKAVTHDKALGVRRR